MSLCVLHHVQEPKSEVVMPRLGGKLQVEVGFSSSGGSSPFLCFPVSAVGTGPDLGLQQTEAVLKPMCLCEYSPVQDRELSLSSLLVSQTSEWVCQGVTEVCLQTPLQTKSSCRES